MNKVYKTVWNEALNAWVAVSEIDHAQGKPSRTGADQAAEPQNRVASFGKKLRLSAIAVSLLLMTPMSFAYVAIGGMKTLGDTQQDVAVTNAGSVTQNGKSKTLEAAASDTVGHNAINYDNPGSLGYDNPTVRSNRDYSGNLGAATGIAIGAGANAIAAKTFWYNSTQTESSGVAVGDYAKASGPLSIALGAYSIGGATGAAAIGTAARADGFNSLAMMRQSAAMNDYAMAIGTVAWASGKGSLAVGQSSQAAGDRSIAIGSANVGNSTTDNGTRISGYQPDTNTRASGDRSIALGAKARTESAADDSIALGSTALSVTGGSIAIGENATAGRADMDSPQDTSNRTTVGKRNNIAIGSGAVADGGRNISIGEYAARNTTDNWNIQNVNIGTQAGEASKKDYSVAVGYEAGALISDAAKTAQTAVADGNRTPSVYIGKQAGKDTAAYGGIGIGERTLQNVVDTNSSRNIAIGASAGNGLSSNDAKNLTFGAFGAGANIMVGNAAGYQLRGDGNTIVGNLAGRSTTGDNNILMGHLAGSTSTSDRSIIMGPQSANNTSNNDRNVLIGNFVNGGSGFNGMSIRNAVGIGSSAVASGNESVAVGRSVKATAANTVAIGHGAQATATNAISIGTGNVVSGENSGAIGDPTTITGTGTYTIGNNNGTVSANSAGAFGNNNNLTGNESRVIGNSNTVEATGSMVMGNNAQATGSSNSGIIAIGNNSQGSANNTVSVGTNAVASKNSSIAIGQQANASNAQSMALGYSSAASGAQSIAFGNTSAASSQGAVAIGWNANANKQQAVALGSNSTTATNATSETSATVKGVTYSGFAGQASANGMQVSVGSAGNERQIKNVAAGNISATSTDAINGSQLYLVANGLVDQMPVVYTDAAGNKVYKQPDGTFKNANGDTVDAGDVIASMNNPNGSTTNPTTLTNIASNLPATTANSSVAGASNVTSAAAPNNISTIGSRAATVNDVLNSGWNLQGNGVAKDFVASYDTVNFVDGKGTVATITSDGTTSKVQYDVKVDGQTIKVDDSGNLTVNTDNLPKSSGTVVQSEDGSVTVAKKDKDAEGNNVYDVAVAKADLTPNADGTVSNNKAGNTFATGDDVAKAINNSGFKLTTSASEGEASGSAEELVKSGETLTIDAGKNIKVTQDGKKITVATKDEVDFTKVSTGNTVMNDKGITINNGAAGKPVELTKDGLNNGGNKIANVAEGVDDTDAVNVSQLNKTIAANKTTLKEGKNTTVEGDGSATNPFKVNVADQVAFGEKGANGQDGVDGKVAVNGKDGSSVVIDGADGSIGAKGADGTTGVSLSGKDGSIGFNGKDGASATVTVKEGVPAVDGKDGETKPRMVVNNEEVATMNDGLKFAGNNSDVSNVQKLNTKVNIVGEGVDKAASASFESAAGNINVKADGGDTLTIQLNKDIKGLNSLQANTVTADTVKAGDTTINNEGVIINNGPSITKTNVDMAGQQIHNVAPGTADTDAVNVGQLKAANANIHNRIDGVENKANAGIAQAMATAGLPQAYLPGKSMLAIGGGVYRGEAGYAIGFSSISDGGNWIIKGTASGNSRGNYGATAAVGYQW